MTRTDSSESEAESDAETETVEVEKGVLERLDRRDLIRGTAATTALMVLGVGVTGSASAASGTIPAPSEPPFLRVRGERMNFVVLSSDPSSPDGGEMWVVD